MKQNIAIIFTDQHLAYAPTIHNLFACLSSLADVKILALRPISFPELNLTGIEYIDIIAKRFESKIFKAKSYLRLDKTIDFDEVILLRRFQEVINNGKFDKFIAVDFQSLYIAQKLIHDKEIHFLSLEIVPSPWKNKVDLGNVESVFIQTKERYDYVFQGSFRHPVFYVQNAPIYRHFTLPINRDKNIMLHAGTAQPIFGVYPILNFVNKTPYCVHFKGFVTPDVKIEINKLYVDLLCSDEVTIDENYSSEDEIIPYISKYRIGFCFYDFVYPQVNNFNYETAPSGKMFKYFAAGVPVIGIDIPGLSYIRDFDTGVLIKDLSSSSILKAIESVEKDYDAKVRNCLKLARELSFDSCVQPYIDFISCN